MESPSSQEETCVTNEIGSADLRAVSKSGDISQDLKTGRDFYPVRQSHSESQQTVVDHFVLSSYTPAPTEISQCTPLTSVIDRIHFLINNLEPTNLDVKVYEMRELLKPDYMDYVAQYLVSKRLCAETTNVSLCTSFVDGLMSPEREFLRELGDWLAVEHSVRNKPILSKDLPLKSLTVKLCLILHQYQQVDAFGKLIVVLVTKFIPEPHVAANGAMPNRIMGIVANVLQKDQEERKDPTSDLGTLNGCNARVMFAWLDVYAEVTVLLYIYIYIYTRGQKGWVMMQRLLVELLKFMEPYLHSAEMNEAIRMLYKGTLRVLLVDLLPEIQSSPQVRSNYVQSLSGIKVDLDNYLKTELSAK
ncbi:hypothetical protein Pelo_18540 [Pelomyxa schiedti]|nr:hypothetical protein Pelo_18540 [Pelomyxa schiedti]